MCWTKKYTWTRMVSLRNKYRYMEELIMTTAAINADRFGKGANIKTMAMLLIPCAVMYLFISRPDVLRVFFTVTLFLAYAVFVDILLLGRGSEIEEYCRMIASAIAWNEKD